MWNANCGASFEWVGRAINPYLGFLTGWLMITGYVIGAVAGVEVIGPAVLAVFTSASGGTWADIWIATGVSVVMHTPGQDPGRWPVPGPGARAAAPARRGAGHLVGRHQPADRRADRCQVAYPGRWPCSRPVARRRAGHHHPVWPRSPLPGGAGP